MSSIIRKVASFVIHAADGDEEDSLLVFDHPLTGFQLPAGTVEHGERLEAAARREIREETGIHIRTSARVLGSETVRLPPDRARMLDTVESEETGEGERSRGELITFRRGHRVELLERDQNRWRVRESVLDYTKEPPEPIDTKVGWVPMKAITTRLERTFFRFGYDEDVTRTDESHQADGREVTVKWISPSDAQTLFGQQSRWLDEYFGQDPSSG
jgi:8-oxo-dGTP pyrophosphatase MutT (NUDIX family)